MKLLQGWLGVVSPAHEHVDAAAHDVEPGALLFDDVGAAAGEGGAGRGGARPVAGGLHALRHARRSLEVGCAAGSSG